MTDPSTDTAPANGASGSPIPMAAPPSQADEALRRAQDALLSANERIVTLVRRHPVPCVLGAVAVGYFVGRAASRRWLK